LKRAATLIDHPIPVLGLRNGSGEPVRYGAVDLVARLASRRYLDLQIDHPIPQRFARTVA